MILQRFAHKVRLANPTVSLCSNNEGQVGGGFAQNSNWGGGALAYYKLMEDFRAEGRWEEKFELS